VAGDPPWLLDVDRGTSRRVVGLPAGQDPFSVAPLGDDAVIAGDREVFVLRHGAQRAHRVGTGTNAVASRDGRGVWLLEHGRGCTLREVGLEGRTRRPPRRVPCGGGLLADTPRGLLVWTEPAGGGDGYALLDPGTGRAVARYPEVHGVVGDQVLWGGPERHAGPFTLTDRRTGARHPVARPTPHGWAGSGRPSPDGRLVLAGDFDRFGEALAVWRPGQDHLAIRRLDLPEHDGSDSFVAWPAAVAASG
jgi:hypothetical protein